MDKTTYDSVLEALNNAKGALEDPVIGDVVAPSQGVRAIAAIYDLMDATSFLVQHVHHEGMK